MVAVVCSQTHNEALNDAAGGFVSHLIWGKPDGFDKFCSVAIMDAGRIIAGAIFHNYQPDDGVIEVSIASQSRRWLTRDNINAILSVPFDGLGCQLVVSRMSEGAPEVLRLNRWLGFEQITIPRLRGRNAAEVIGTLTEEAWRSHPVYNRRDQG